MNAKTILIGGVVGGPIFSERKLTRPPSSCRGFVPLQPLRNH